MYVLGGNFNAPTNEVQIYDPASNTWSVGAPFAIAGRNFAADTDGTNNIWKAGGYDSGLAIIASMEIFNCPVSPCASRLADAYGNSNAYGISNSNANAQLHQHLAAELPPHRGRVARRTLGRNA